MPSLEQVSSTTIFGAAGVLLHITQFPLERLFNFLDLPSSLYKDAPINFKFIGCLHFEYTDGILLTCWECCTQLTVFAEVGRGPDFPGLFTLEISHSTPQPRKLPQHKL